MRKCLYVCVLAALASCSSNEEYQQKGDVFYKPGQSTCTQTNKNHWLMDLVASNSKDSVYLNTITLKRKIEVHKLQLDTSSALYAILENTCSEDSITLKLPAKSFYAGLNGQVPAHLADDEQITVDVYMRSKLTDMEHISHKTLFERRAMASFVQANRWNSTQDSTTRIYYELLKTKENTSKNYNRAKVKYTISGLNNKVIAIGDANSPLVYDVKDKGVLKGIQFLMSKIGGGESIRGVIPSSQAFGQDGNQRIPGFTPLLIELEVLEVLE